MTKCLPCTCCQCGVNLSSYEEGRRPLELFCDCLVALCTDCGLQQAIRHITITGSYLECPVCRCKESNHRNGYVCEAQVVYYASLLLRKDTLLRFPYASKSKDEKSLQILASLYLQCGFADGMEGVEGVGSMGLTQLGLFTARCEAHLQRLGYAPDAGAPPAVVGVVSLPLDLGPLESLKLKENLVLVKVLGLLEEQAKEEEGKGKGKQNEAEAKEEEKEEGKGKQDEDQEGKQHQEDEQEEGDALTRLQEELPTICQLCFDDLVPGNTVRGRCHCCSKCCQLCTRRSVKNLREGIKCSLCRAPIPVDTKEAKANQNELVVQLIDQQTHKSSLTDPLKLQLCWEIRNLTNIPSDFHIGEEVMDGGTAPNEGVLNLGLARVQADLLRRAELQRQTDAQGTSTLASPSDYLPLGPVGRLAIRRDHFLECVLRAMGQGADGGETPGDPLYLPDPEAYVDETKPVMKLPDAPGGKLEGGREVRLQTAPLSHLLRSQPTPCPHPCCSVDPRCPHYLAMHIHHFHGVGTVGTGPLNAALVPGNIATPPTPAPASALVPGPAPTPAPARADDPAPVPNHAPASIHAPSSASVPTPTSAPALATVPTPAHTTTTTTTTTTNTTTITPAPASAPASAPAQAPATTTITTIKNNGTTTTTVTTTATPAPASSPAPAPAPASAPAPALTPAPAPTTGSNYQTQHPVLEAPELAARAKRPGEGDGAGDEGPALQMPRHR